MENRKFEQMLESVLKQDFSAGTESFRDALLARCLEELPTAESAIDSNYHAIELPDEALSMLSAAGDIYQHIQTESD